MLDPGLTATGPDYEALVASRARRAVQTIRSGTEFKTGGLVVRVLWPPDPGLPAEDPNLNATVLVATYGELDVFLPADAESDVTSRLAWERSRSSRSRIVASADPTGLDDQPRRAGRTSP